MHVHLSLQEILPRFSVNMRQSEQVPDRDSFCLLRSSTDKCKEQIKSVASKCLKVLLSLVLESTKDMTTLS